MTINVFFSKDDNKSVGSSYIVPLPVYYMLHRHLTHRGCPFIWTAPFFAGTGCSIVEFVTAYYPIRSTTIRQES